MYARSSRIRSRVIWVAFRSRFISDTCRVICSFSSYLFLQGTNVHVVFLASLAACLAAATLFRYVEFASIRFAKALFSEALMRRLPVTSRHPSAAAMR